MRAARAHRGVAQAQVIEAGLLPDRLDAASGGARAMIANLGLLERQLAEARAGLDQARGLAASASRALHASLLDERTFVELVVTRLEKEQQVLGLDQQVLEERTSLATLFGVGLPPVRLLPPTAHQSL